MVTFVVEAAGCETCATRVRTALEPLVAVEVVSIDEAADEAVVRAAGEVSEDAVNEALQAASPDARHAYRVRPGSWHVG